MENRCNKCGSLLPEDAMFCIKCGAKVNAVRCPSCGKLLPESQFCLYCGNPLTEASRSEHHPKKGPETAEHAKPIERPELKENTARGIGADSIESADIQPGSEEQAAPLQSPAAETDTVEDPPQTTSTPQTQNTNSFQWKYCTALIGPIVILINADLLAEGVSIGKGTESARKYGKVKTTEIAYSEIAGTSIRTKISSLLLTLYVALVMLTAYLNISGLVEVGIALALGALVLIGFPWMFAFNLYHKELILITKSGESFSVPGPHKEILLPLQKAILVNMGKTIDEQVPDAVIQKNVQYFSAQFKRVQEHGTAFNWSACLLGPVYCLYRKSWGVFREFFLTYNILLGTLNLLIFASIGTFSAVDGFNFTTWIGLCAIVEILLQAYGVFCAVRCGRNFNIVYYRSCLIQKNLSDAKGKTAGVSVGWAALAFLLLGCYLALIATISGVFLEKAITGHAPGLQIPTIEEDVQEKERDLLEEQELKKACYEKVVANVSESPDYIDTLTFPDYEENGPFSSVDITDGYVYDDPAYGEIYVRNAKVVGAVNYTSPDFPGQHLRSYYTATLTVYLDNDSSSPDARTYNHRGMRDFIRMDEFGFNGDYTVDEAGNETSLYDLRTVDNEGLAAFLDTRCFATVYDLTRDNYYLIEKYGYVPIYGITMELMEIDGAYYAYVWQNLHEFDYGYVECKRNGDPLLPVISTGERTWQIIFDVEDSSAEEYTIEGQSTLTLTVNATGKMFAQVSGSREMSNTQVEVLSAWLNGAYKYYDEAASTTYDMEQDENRNFSIMECEGYLQNYFYGTWWDENGTMSTRLEYDPGSIYILSLSGTDYRNSGYTLRFSTQNDPSTVHTVWWSSWGYEEAEIDGELRFR